MAIKVIAQLREVKLAQKEPHVSFFCSVIAHTKFYLGSISERPLIVLDELFPVIFL